jgi:hypothetical protein
VRKHSRGEVQGVMPLKRFLAVIDFELFCRQALAR